jgi:hypothetical protein
VAAWRPVSLVLEASAATRLVRNISRYPGTHWLVNMGTRIDLGGRTRLDVGMTENIIDQQSTTDLAFYFALGLHPQRPASATALRQNAVVTATLW